MGAVGSGGLEPAMKMEASKTAVHSYQTTTNHNPQNHILNFHCREDPKSYNVKRVRVCHRSSFPNFLVSNGDVFLVGNICTLLPEVFNG
jgi:hypothetical protein